MGENSMIDTSVLQQNPFPGIRPYSGAEDKFFFGREGVISDVISQLRENRFVALVGPSASGKTSLIQSGIIPSLLSEEHQEWVPVSVCPGLKPVESLFRGFQQVFPKKLKEADVRTYVDGSQMLSDLIVEKGLGSHNYLLIIDQFEDLFRPGQDGKSRLKFPETRRYIDLLVSAAMETKTSIHVLLSIRSDFIEASSHFRPLTELMNQSKLFLPPMSREALSDSINGPVQQTGARFEAGFVDFVLEDLEDLDYPLPKLQHAMKRTWDFWSAQEDKEQPISISDYQAIGTVESALQDHLEEAFGELDDQQRFICERLFKSITSKSEQQSGFRRPATLIDIARIAGTTVEDLVEVVDVFRKPGRGFLLPATRSSLTAESQIELSHESLIMVWGRLRKWVDEEDESIRMYLKLSEASALYQQGRTELWVDSQLQIALEWRDSQRPTPAWGVQYHPAFERAMVFLKTSEEEKIWEEERKIIQQRRRLLINRGVAIFMGLMVVVLGLVFILSRVNSRDFPETEEVLAEEVPVEAGRDRVEQPASGQVAGSEELLEESIQAAEVTEQTIESRNETAVTGRQDQELEAPVVSRRTEENVVREDPGPRENTRTTNTQATNQARSPAISNADRLRVAREAAQTSLGLTNDPELQGLLAFQAYRLNSQGGGNSQDRDIYNALYASMKKLISPAYNIYQGIRTSVKDIQWLRRTGSILIASSDGSMKILSGNYTNTGSQINLQGTGFNNECMILSPDEKLAAVGTNGGGLVFVELENKGSIVQQNAEEGSIVLFLSRLGNTGDFVSAGTENRIIKWDFQFGQPQTLLNTHARVSALAASRNGRDLAYATRDGKLYELDVNDAGKQQLIGDYGRAPARALAYNPVSSQLVVGLRDGSIQVLTGNPRKRQYVLSGPQASITDMSFSPDGRFLAAASNDGKVYLWTSENWRQAPLVFDENNGFVLSVCFSASSRDFYSGSVDFPRLVGRPAESAVMTDGFCGLVNRNLSTSEWEQYFGSVLPYEETCPK